MFGQVENKRISNIGEFWVQNHVILVEIGFCKLQDEKLLGVPEKTNTYEISTTFEQVATQRCLFQVSHV